MLKSIIADANANMEAALRANLRIKGLSDAFVDAKIAELKQHLNEKRFHIGLRIFLIEQLTILDDLKGN